MRVAIDCRVASVDWAGMRNYALHLVRELDRSRACDLVLLGLEDRAALPDGSPARVVPPLGRLAYRALMHHLQPTCRYTGPVDLFHSTAFWPFRVGRGSQVVTIPDLTPLMRPEWHPRRRRLAFRWMIRFLLANARRVIAISESTRRDVIRFYGYPADRIDVTHLAASDCFRPMTRHETRPMLEKHGLTWRGFILFAGTLEPRKNIERLVEACEPLRGAPLVVVGRPGWNYGPILRRLRNSRGDVRILGYVDAADLAALMASAAVLCYPSLYEGFGLPPLEAMASGTPVVTSNAGSLPEVVGEAGLLVDPCDVKALREALRRVLEDASLRDRLSALGLERSRLFTWKKCAAATLESYRRALN